MNLTKNQEEVLNCMRDGDNNLKNICVEYAKIMHVKGYNPLWYVWSSSVSNKLNQLIKKGYVQYVSRGVYSKLKIN
ncbi:hypothetical protein Phi10:1_gp073 [Cellulophaga phage phi10:1]|uniref:Uncharacterized protein n=1 Tax=Cellulophaga phage phi10:1 TaxID=1327981 RepID=R9ZYI9_9CAUD|nr:hypothetical protein Phi10:1_gp073 [Cellulophaga phage phi10:1]AGO48414.1 hypothetical protein Phi10:1_gp073 [Cellulophaga phage phi10:1]